MRIESSFVAVLVVGMPDVEPMTRFFWTDSYEQESTVSYEQGSTRMPLADYEGVCHGQMHQSVLVTMPVTPLVGHTRLFQSGFQNRLPTQRAGLSLAS